MQKVPKIKTHAFLQEKTGFSISAYNQLIQTAYAVYLIMRSYLNYRFNFVKSYSILELL